MAADSGFSADRDLIVALDLRAPGTDPAQTDQLVQLFREELVRTGRFSLSDRSEMNDELAKLGFPRGEGCETASCFDPLTRRLGVYKIVAAQLERRGSAYALSAQWISTGQRTTTRSASLPQPIGTMREVFATGMARLASQVASLASEPRGGGGGPAKVDETGSSDGAKPWLEKGYALRQPNGDYQPADLAAYEFSKAVAAEPNNAAAHAARGQVYLQLQQYEDALSDYDQAIRVEPRRASHYYGRALVHEALHQGNLECADLRKACELGDPASCGFAKRRGC